MRERLIPQDIKPKVKHNLELDICTLTKEK